MSSSAILELNPQRVSAAAADVDSLDLVYPHDVQAGNRLVVQGSVWVGDGRTSLQVTDTRGTHYDVRMAPFVSGAGQAMAFVATGLAPSSGPCTATVTPVLDTSDAAPLLGGI
jgi:hypothetical protein